MSILISIITPTFNAKASTLNLINDLKRQIVDFSFEHIIVDDHSDEAEFLGLKECVDKLKLDGLNISLFRQSVNAGPGAARNFAVKKATGRYILFLDSDCFILNDNYLTNCVSELKRHEEKIVGGTVAGTGKGYIAFSDHYCHWMTNLPGYTGPAPQAHLVTANMAMTMATWQKVGPFNELLRSGEDVDFCARGKRAGISLYLSDAFRVGHYDRESLSSFYKNFFFCGTYRNSFPGDNDWKRKLVTGGPQWFRFLIIPMVGSLLVVKHLTGWIRHDWRVLLALPGILIASFAMATGLAFGLKR